jgi:DnaJ-class molecular chaperone
MNNSTDTMCPDCDGTGSIDLFEWVHCNRCDSTGTVPRPKPNATIKLPRNRSFRDGYFE